MSHYRVAVYQTPTSPSLDELMAPYDENLRVAPYVCETKAEAIANARMKIEAAKNRSATGVTTRFDGMLIAHEGDDDETLHKWYAQEYCEQETDEDGNILTTYNPKSKYDYYCEMETLTFDEWLATGSEESEDELRREWETLSTRGDGFYNELYYLNRYRDEDTFIKACKQPGAWAIVTPDGEWHEPGQVGWFGMDNATSDSFYDWTENFTERFVTPYEGETVTVAILDCHI